MLEGIVGLLQAASDFQGHEKLGLNTLCFADSKSELYRFGKVDLKACQGSGQSIVPYCFENPRLGCFPKPL